MHFQVHQQRSSLYAAAITKQQCLKGVRTRAGVRVGVSEYVKSWAALELDVSFQVLIASFLSAG